MQQTALARTRYVDYRSHGVGSHRFMTGRATEFFGRLVRVSRFRGDRDTVAYIVAIANPDDAMEIIRTKIAEPGYMIEDYVIEDLGRVSDALLRSLNLSSGEFVRADAPRRA
jgi:hypothetical protein